MLELWVEVSVHTETVQAPTVVPSGQVATVGQQDEQLFKAVGKMAEWRLDQFNAQGLVNTAWACATVGQQDEQLVKALAKMAERRLDQFNAQDLANMAWALTDSACLHR